jgi:hypothetical protein
MLEGQLNHFNMYDDEMPHEMFNWLKKLVNKARALGSKKVDRSHLDKKIDDGLHSMNYNVVALICQEPIYNKMSSDVVLGRIINYEMNIKEANSIKNLYKGVSTSKKKDIPLKANKGKTKKVLIESPSKKGEEEDEREYDEDEVALFIKKFNKFIKKRRPYKGDRREKPRSKRVCCNCGKNGHFIAQCPYERKEEDNENKRKLDKGYKKDKKFIKKPYGQAHVSQK